jgi:tetratricopeptide (TPR) repeat protein
VNPEYPDAHSNLGVALAGTGKPDRAIAEFEKALEINPGSAEARNNLGRALAGMGKLDEAIPHFLKALEITPESASIRGNLGRALAEKGRFDEAIPHFQKALEIQPGAAEIHNGLAVAPARHQPEFTAAQFNLGDTLYYLKGNAPEALEHWRIVLRLDPDDVPVLNQTAWVLATHPEASLRDGAQAVELAERAARLTERGNPAILDTLAAAYAEVGRYREAAEIARQNLALAAQRNNQRLAETLKVRLALYEIEAPFRETRPG